MVMAISTINASRTSAPSGSNFNPKNSATMSSRMLCTTRLIEV